LGHDIEGGNKMKYSVISININEIWGIHPQIEEAVIVSIGKYFVENDAIASMNPSVTRKFFEFPRFTVEKLKGKFYVVHGFRELELARIIHKTHGKDFKVAVLLAKGRRNADDRINAVIHQLFFAHAMYSLAPGWTKQFGQIFKYWQDQYPEEFENLSLIKSGKKTTLTSLSKLLGINPTTIF